LQRAAEDGGECVLSIDPQRVQAVNSTIEKCGHASSVLDCTDVTAVIEPCNPFACAISSDREVLFTSGVGSRVQFHVLGNRLTPFRHAGNNEYCLLSKHEIIGRCVGGINTQNKPLLSVTFWKNGTTEKHALAAIQI
jgi:hypothetical protein